MTSQAEHLPALHSFCSKNIFCAGSLCYPAMIALENNGFMTSQHDSSFDDIHSLRPGMLFELFFGSSAAHQKSSTTGIIASQSGAD